MTIDWTKPLHFPESPEDTVLKVVGTTRDGRYVVELTQGLKVVLTLYTVEGKPVHYPPELRIANLPPKPAKRWVNVLRAKGSGAFYSGGTMYSSRSEALRFAGLDCVATVEVEFVEPSPHPATEEAA